MLIPVRAAIVASDALPELISQVQLEEPKYDEIALAVSSNYKKLAADLAGEILEQESITTIVRTGRSFRVRKETNSKTTTNTISSVLVHSSNGKQHFELSRSSFLEDEGGELKEQPESIVILTAPPALSNLARPHMLLLEDGCPQVPLSVYLRGQTAISQHPNPGYLPDAATIEVTLNGRGTVQGLSCHRVLIDTLINGKRHNGWELWLADERNLIPARVLSYTYRWSGTLPIADKYVYEWQELGDDVWCPKKFQVTRYDSEDLKLGKKIVNWKKHFAIEHATLSPDIDAETFAPPSQR